ncbi:hypothetical protein ACNKHW_23880 [Shigella flexneri]
MEEHNALANTIVVVASASEPAALRSGSVFRLCNGEYFRDRGEDALIIYDDLSKPTVAYRQISLLLRRPPGREAYPGRRFLSALPSAGACCASNAEYVEAFTKGEVKGKTGSLTALPINETQAGTFQRSFRQTLSPSLMVSLPGIWAVQRRIRPAVYPGIPVSVWVVQHRPRS